jgi:hypothetical protein
MEAVKARAVNFYDLDWRAACFIAAYRALIRVLQRPLSTSPTSVPYKTPPHQVTVPANPNLSKESHSSMGSTGSSASCESKPESFSERFLDEFVTGVLSSIEDKLAMPIPWLRQDHSFSLSMEYDFCCALTLTR